MAQHGSKTRHNQLAYTYMASDTRSEQHRRVDLDKRTAAQEQQWNTPDGALETRTGLRCSQCGTAVLHRRGLGCCIEARP